MASPKRLRAKRARARWREKRGHDLRPQYREADLPATAHVAATTIEDAYAPAGRVDKVGILHVEAALEPVRHRDGTLSEGAPAWTPPERPRWSRDRWCGENARKRYYTHFTPEPAMPI